jgi:hypothetical protein
MLSEVFIPNTRTPVQLETQVLTAGGTSQRVAVKGGTVLRLVNTHATQSAHINFGNGAETAVVAVDMVIPPVYGVLFVRVPMQAKSMSYIASGATTLVYMTEGQ